MGTTFNKAIVATAVPIVIGIILFVLSAYHITEQMTVQQVVTLLVTSLLSGGGVYQTTNKS